MNSNLVRVTVQLIDARADAARWTLTYERPIGDVFALQDQIAADVSGELEAHKLLLQARHLSRQFTSGALARASELLEQALVPGRPPAAVGTSIRTTPARSPASAGWPCASTTIWPAPPTSWSGPWR